MSASSTSSIQKSIFIVLLLLVTRQAVSAQGIPEIPASVLFGGINVKFDRDARRMIESDVRSLMANKRYWNDKMDRAVLYFPILEGVLIEEEIPIDFKYLAVQESSLSPDAVSTSNAVGFWQFKRETAMEMGLRVDNEIDERKNIASSTRAAARYLKRSNQQYNNWVSSLYSYYLGMGGISKIVPANWAYAREITLTGSTDQYVLRFFAHKIALEASLDLHRSANAIVLLEYRNGRGQNLNQIARDMGVNPTDLKNYNQWLASNEIPSDREYMVALPVTSPMLNEVRQKLATATTSPSPMYTQNDIGFPVLKKAEVKLKGSNNPDFYEINGLPGIQARAGDKAADLARIARISTSNFLKYNDLSPREPLIAGHVYYLAKKHSKAMVPFHTVREGETIRSISHTYGIATKYLLKNNRISNRNQRLQTGRVMWLMKKRPARTPVEVMEIPAQQPVPNVQPDLIGKNDPQIPQDASERKKYSPKLVATTEKPEEKVAENPPVRDEKPSAVSTAPRTVNDTGNRIVIIGREEAPAATRPSTPERRPSPSEPDVKSQNSTGMTTARRSGSTGNIHVVANGQTYYSISKMYNIGIQELLDWNQLTLNDVLEVGQKLQVSKSAAVVPASDGNTGGITYHKVAAGETLYSISKRYGVSMSDIQRVNAMSDTNVKLGQSLKIPRN